MEIIAIIVVGGLIARFLGGGGNDDHKGSDTSDKMVTKANDDWYRHTHLNNEYKKQQREEARRNRDW